MQHGTTRYYRDINCICVGTETSDEYPDQYTSWCDCLFFGKRVTRRQSDDTFLRTVSYLCCIPLFSASRYYESHGDGFTSDSVYCCVPPCCVECIETTQSCQCNCTCVGCPVRTCYQQEFDPIAGEKYEEGTVPPPSL